MKNQRKTGVIEVDEYLARVPADMRASLQELRRTVREVAPEAEEVVSYQVPAFRLNGMLVWYAAFKDHCSFFVGSTVILRKYAAELKPFRAGKGTLQFTPERPIPATLVRRIVLDRVVENKSRAASKRARA
jgi:uncharacterized protein YdhG (YjbR/CyaY superfamily)